MSIKAILILLAVAACFGGGYYVRDLQDTTKADTAVISQVAHNQETERHDDGTIAIEKKAFDDAQLQPVAAPIVRMCIAAPTRAVLPARPTPIGAHAEAAGAEPNQPDFVQGPDIGRPLVTIGRDADAQIAGLQDYITQVCRPKT